MSGPKRHNFIVQGSILAIAGIVCRLIGMFYRIPLIQIIGTKGNGYYTSAYSIYNIMLIISSYSRPLAVSKLVSSRLGNGRFEDVRRILRAAFLYSTVVGGLMFALMFFGSDLIAGFLGKPFVTYVIRTLAPTVWIMAYLGILRGYFQGTGNMMPTAVSQILEQIVNAVMSVLMAWILFGYGVQANAVYGETEYSYAYGAAGGTVGTGAGALTALLFFIILYLLRGREILEEEGRGGRSRQRTESYAHIFAALLLTLLPILFSSFIYNISTVLDDFVFSNVMTALGLSGSVVFLWGVFGEYRILFNIPVAVANSLASSVIPSLTAAVSARDRREIVRKIVLSVRVTMVIAMPAAVGLGVLAGPVSDLLFYGQDNRMLADVLRFGSIAVVFYSLSTITNAVLQGLGHLSEPLRNSVIALVIHVGALLLLLYRFRLGIHAVIASNIIFAIIVCLLNHRCIHRHVRFRENYRNNYLAPFVSSAVMGLMVYAVYRLLLLVSGSFFTGRRLGLMILTLICIAAALLVYFPVLLSFRIFNRDELMEVPGGRILFRLMSRFGTVE